MKAIKNSVSIFLCLQTLFESSQAYQKEYKGKETDLSLPLADQETNLLQMSLKYWTVLKETKDCVIDAYECRLDEYDEYLEADLSL